MRLVVDTNVFISGVFFSGPPYEILKAWKAGKVQLVVSPEIMDEYRRVGDELSKQYRGTDVEPFLELLGIHAIVVEAPPLSESVCSDPDDDKFLACAIASRTRTVCSGDKALLRTSGYKGIKVLSPRLFVENCLKRKR
ncbi:MAG: putative toxin-antitoxin system toxin component, PIN family [Verrucomicrobia bacterium]|nr:putative toxin-antitoxin system toxin component, PIN family [Verrucomicrobiota bacterium]